MRRLPYRLGGVVICAALALSLAGCGDDDKKGMGDAPVLNRHGDDTPAEVFNFPDHFGNLATKCVGHGYRAYVTTNFGAPSNIEVVPDPACVTADPSASPTPGAQQSPSSAPSTTASVAPDVAASSTPAAAGVPTTTLTGLAAGSR